MKLAPNPRIIPIKINVSTLIIIFFTTQKRLGKPCYDNICMADNEQKDPQDPLETKKIDPLDPLESAYESDVFHGDPIMDDVYIEPELPPPPPISIFKRILKAIPFLIGIIILLLLGYLAYNYFLGRNGKGGPADLNYWTLWEDDSVYQPLIEEYQQQHSGVTVTLQKQSIIQYRERLQTHIASGEGPDIFRFHNTWTPMLQGELSAMPSGVMTRAEFKEAYYPVIVEDLSVGETTVGLPLMFDGLMVFYNKDILQAAGFSVPSSDWNEFLLQAENMTVKQGNKIVTAGAALGRADNIEHFSDILGLLMLQNGANPARPNTDAGAGGLVFYRIFAQTPDNVWSSEFDNDILAFAGGKVAMIFAPSWEAFTIAAINPDLNFSTSPVPQVAGAEKQVAWASYWAEGVNAKSPNQQQAWEFLKFMAQKESLEKFYKLTAETRVLFGEPYPRRDLVETLGQNEYLASLAQQGEYAQSFYMASRTFDNGINDGIIQYYKNAVNSLDSGNSPQEALETAAQGITQVLERFNVVIE